ncbi:MAG: metallophosphoesterase [Clostridia bacterium]|nr:metallophosphoesterase [Clostridia bacterium]
MKIRIISIITLIAMIFSVAAMGVLSSSAAVAPKENKWYVSKGSINPDTYDYTFAFVGDIQSITEMDYFTGTNYVDTLFSWIANNVETKKIQHVFTLGDLTEWSSENDNHLSYATGKPESQASGNAEWNIVKNAIQKLDGVVPYSVVRGNHDDYKIDDYFNYEAYTKNFNGFYDGSMEPAGNAKASAWAQRYYQDGSITNSYRLVTINGTKFIFITLDFNPTPGVMAWVDKLLTDYADYNAIITLHSYAQHDYDEDRKQYYGRPLYPNEVQTVIVSEYNNNISPRVLWNNCFSKHENIVMTVSGHIGVEDPFYFETTGENGNVVANFLVNPQSYDKKIQPTGMVFLMHFKNGETTIRTEYYSTNLERYKLDNNKSYTLNLKVGEVPSVDDNTDTTETTTTVSAAPEKKGCKGSVSLVSIALVPAFAGVSLAKMRKKKEN